MLSSYLIFDLPNGNCRERFPSRTMHICLLSVLPTTFPTHCSSLLSVSYHFQVTCCKKLNNILSRTSKVSKSGKKPRETGCKPTCYGAASMLCRMRHKRITSLRALQHRLDSLPKGNFPLAFVL